MPTPDLTSPTLTVVAWDDPVVDSLGYPARSTYVERFWLPILGPSTTWLIRRIDAGLSDSPSGITLDLEATAGALGLGAGRGRHSPLVRALHRSCQFGMARPAPDADLAVRRNLPPLTRRQIERLPSATRDAHGRWRDAERDAPGLDPQRRRARHMAMGLVELGEDAASLEQRLLRLSVHPAVAHDAAAWAQRIVRDRPDRQASPRPSPPLRQVPAGTPTWGDDAA